jgi:hypothetical protein
MIRKFNRGNEISDDVDRIGDMAVDILREAVEDLHEPPNSPVTIARKGGNNPLVDTGFLAQSIEWKLKE